MSGNYSKCSYLRPVEWVKGKAVGSGSFGSVHLAMNKATGGLFVVKSAESEAGLQFLENEANILESLDSPHIVKCIGKEICGGGKNGVKNLFMEYMAGGSLADVAEQFGGKLDEMVIRLYTKEILLGLKYLHENGIVHSDLKCKNVLLTSSGDVKLADFGCSKRTKEPKAKPYAKNIAGIAGIAGSPLWMAPEMLRKERVDFASDIWSLGCTIIEMGTGKLPWAGEISNPISTVLRIACSNDKPNFPTNFSEEGLDFLEKCLERDPRKRWKAEELLNHPFILEKNKPNFNNFVIRQEFASSPASVLDKSIFPETEYSDESDDDDEAPCGNSFPFSMLCEKKIGVSEELRFQEQWSSSSEEWITVR